MKISALALSLAIIGSSAMSQEITQISCVAVEYTAAKNGRVSRNEYPFHNIEIDISGSTVVGVRNIHGCSRDYTFEVSDSRIDARCRGSVVEASLSISRISGEFSYSGRDNTNGVDYLATGSCEKHTGQKF